MSRGLLHRLRAQARRKRRADQMRKRGPGNRSQPAASAPRRAAPVGNPPNGQSNPGRYLTDGMHLYEVERTIVNSGRLGGYHVVVRDCRTEDLREMGTLELALCTAIRSAAG